MESNIAGSVNDMREKARSTRSRTAHAALMMFRNARLRYVDSIVAVRLNHVVAVLRPVVPHRGAGGG